jgi:hypothetical protein
MICSIIYKLGVGTYENNLKTLNSCRPKKFTPFQFFGIDSFPFSLSSDCSDTLQVLGQWQDGF